MGGNAEYVFDRPHCVGLGKRAREEATLDGKTNLRNMRPHFTRLTRNSLCTSPAPAPGLHVFSSRYHMVMKT